jgi:hypothetical protein
MVVLSRIIVDGVGGGDGAAPRGSMVDGVVMSDCAKGVVSGRWAAAGEGVEFGRGRRGGNNYGVRGRLLSWSLLPYFTLFYLILSYFTLILPYFTLILRLRYSQ